MNHPPLAGSQPVHGSVNCSPLIAAATANQPKLDAQITLLSEPWSGSLPFPVRVIDDPTVTHKEDVSDVKLQVVDIVNYLNGQKYPCHKLYFSRDVYSPQSLLRLTQKTFLIYLCPIAVSQHVCHITFCQDRN
jgi:hypothetical protein